MADPTNFVSILRLVRTMTPPLSSDSVYEVKTSKVHPPRSTRHLLAGVLVSAVMVALTLTVSAGMGTAGATTSAAKLTVCTKGIVTGNFPFSLNGGATFAVAVNHCVSKPVDAGENLVTELTDPTGATKLQSMVVSPQSANVVHKVKNSKTQAGYTKVNVTSGADVRVTFWNEPVIRQLKVCATAGPSLAGEFFSFTERAGDQIVGPFSVQAEPAGTKLKCGGETSYPVGTNVTVSEAPDLGVYVSKVTVNGSTVQSTICPGIGPVEIPVGKTGTTVVDFTNQEGGDCGPGPGYLEVCSQAGDASVGTGPWTFTISGNGILFTVSALAGQCSGDVPLLVGDYTVTETLAPPDSVSAITGYPTAPVSTNLAEGSGVLAVSNGTTETATFTNDS
jgi:hypothetical protein